MKNLKPKTRKLVNLDNDDMLIVKALAKSRKVSESKVIRMALKELGIKEGIIRDPFKDLIGSVNAGPEQAKNHDEVLYD